MALNDKRILITGGSLGIGKASAQKLVDAGAKVVITGRNESRLKSAAEETGAFSIVADVTSAEDRQRTIDESVSHLGGLDVLVNNAAIGEFSLVEDFTLYQFQRLFDTNVFSLAMLTQLSVKIFREQGKGDIVNIASTAAVNGFERGTVYAATKFALRGMTQCWQKELRKDNIRVIGINPSEVTTAFGDPRPNKLSAEEVAHSIKAVLEMEERGFIPELTLWATNPWRSE